MPCIYLLVLRVSCTTTKKWVQGLEGVPIWANSRYGDAQITTEQALEMESLFHERDNAYRNELHNHTLFHLLYQHENLWPEYCTSTNAIPRYRFNVTSLLKEFRRILRYPGHTHLRIAAVSNENSTTNADLTEFPETDKIEKLNLNNNGFNRKNKN